MRVEVGCGIQSIVCGVYGRAGGHSTHLPASKADEQTRGARINSDARDSLGLVFPRVHRRKRKRCPGGICRSLQCWLHLPSFATSDVATSLLTV